MDEQIQTVRIPGGTARLPVAVALNGNGPRFLVGPELIRPEECDHAGYSWSEVFRLRCGRCGAPMVLPARVIARRTPDHIEEMARAWERAGKPAFRHRRTGDAILVMWADEALENGVMLEHPLFAHLGGLPAQRPWPTSAEGDEG
jgi:hypothetical protein